MEIEKIFNSKLLASLYKEARVSLGIILHKKENDFLLEEYEGLKSVEDITILDKEVAIIMRKDQFTYYQVTLCLLINDSCELGNYRYRTDLECNYLDEFLVFNSL